MLAYVNGSLVEQEQAAVPVLDSGFNFADGVFEGIRVYAGRVFRLGLHLERLYASARAFEIEIGLEPEELAGEILRWLRANGVEDGFHFRPIVTRGDRFPPRLDPRFATGRANLVFVGGPISPAATAGLRVAIGTLRQSSPDAVDPHVKSLNYGNSILGRLEAYRRGVDDLLMLDDRGHLAEATAANLFLVRDGALLTPTTYACLDGVTRRAVIALAGERGLHVEEAALEPAVIASTDEVFLTGTGSELVPVVAVDGRPVGAGAAGPVTTVLRTAYGELVRSEGVPIGPGAAAEPPSTPCRASPGRTSR